MKSKGKKIIMILMFLIVSFSNVMFVSPCEVYAMASDSENIMPLADALGWRYKTVNRVLYKRLYNYSKKQWVGDWIKCK